MRRNTSIFSSKYHKREKRRRFFKKLAIFLFIIAALVLLFRKPLLEMVEKVKQDIAQETVQKEEILEKIPEIIEEEAEEPMIEEPVMEKEYLSVELPIEKEVSLEVLEENGEKIFAPLTELEGMEGDVSPSKSQAVILDKETQDLFLIGVDGTVTDITYKIYKNSKNYTESKESILRRMGEEFVWAEQPKFLDEDTVVYMSALPWFDDRRFLYAVELEPLSHRNYQGVFGKDVVLGELTELGLSYTKEEKTFYFTPEYKIIAE